MKNEALLNFRKSMKKTQQQMADFLNISQPTYASYEIGTREAPYDILKKLANYFNCTIDDLINSHTSKTNGSTKKTLNTKHEPADIIYLPVLASVAGGFDKCPDEYDEITEWQPLPRSVTNGYSRNELFVFTVVGDSMYPEIQDGDRVLVLKTQLIDNDDICVVSYDFYEHGTVKRIRQYGDHIDLIPTNQNHRPIRIKGDDLEGFKILGKVIYLFRQF